MNHLVRALFVLPALLGVAVISLLLPHPPPGVNRNTPVMDECSAPEYVAKYLDLAERLSSQGSYSFAIHDYQKVLACEPGNQQAREGLRKAEDAERVTVGVDGASSVGVAGKKGDITISASTGRGDKGPAGATATVKRPQAAMSPVRQKKNSLSRALKNLNREIWLTARRLR
jgi:hypothetical protein